MKDIFEDIKQQIGWTYISDLPYHKREVWKKFKKLPPYSYPLNQLEVFFLYVFNVKYPILMEILYQEVTCHSMYEMSLYILNTKKSYCNNENDYAGVWFVCSRVWRNQKKLSIEKEENFEIEINRSLIEELGTNEYYFDWCIWIR